MRTEQEIKDKIDRLQEAQDSMTIHLPIHAIVMKELKWVLEEPHSSTPKGEMNARI